VTDNPRLPPRGALQSDWNHFDLVLGLGADLLPVVPDEHAIPSARSAVKKFGKIPSTYDGEGNARGLKDWQKREITSDDIERWSADRRLSMCVRTGETSGVYAIDVDVTDELFADAVAGEIYGEADLTLPRRQRGNSSKFLLLFRVKA